MRIDATALTEHIHSPDNFQEEADAGVPSPLTACGPLAVIGHDAASRQSRAEEDERALIAFHDANLWFFLGYSQPFVSTKELLKIIFALVQVMEGQSVHANVRIHHELIAQETYTCVSNGGPILGCIGSALPL